MKIKKIIEILIVYGKTVDVGWKKHILKLLNYDISFFHKKQKLWRVSFVLLIIIVYLIWESTCLKCWIFVLKYNILFFWFVVFCVVRCCRTKVRRLNYCYYFNHDCCMLIMKSQMKRYSICCEKKVHFVLKWHCIF